jgi:DNA-binding GntR family transcriptional regulator
MLELPVSAFDSANLKRVFAEQFGAPTISVDQSVRAGELKPEVARLVGAPRRASGMVLEVTAYTYGRAPISFQRIHIPASDYPLDVSPIIGPTKASR